MKFKCPACGNKFEDNTKYDRKFDMIECPKCYVSDELEMFEIFITK